MRIGIFIQVDERDKGVPKRTSHYPTLDAKADLTENSEIGMSKAPNVR